MWVRFRTIYLMNIQNDNTRITTTSVKYCQVKISSHKHSFAKSNIINYINRDCTRDVKPNENFKWMNASIKLEKSEWRKKKKKEFGLTALHMNIDFFLFGKLNDYANWTKVGKNKHHVMLRAYLAYFLAWAYKGSKKIILICGIKYSVGVFVIYSSQIFLSFFRSMRLTLDVGKKFYALLISFQHKRSFCQK